MTDLVLQALRYVLLIGLGIVLYRVTAGPTSNPAQGRPTLLAAAVGAGAIALVHGALYWGWPTIGVLYGGAAIIGFPLVSVLLARSGFRGDRVILAIVSALSGLGLAFIYRLRPELLLRQATWFYLGFTLLLWTVHLLRDPAWLARYRYLTALAGLALLVGAVLFGVERGGTRQWIEVGPLSFQPSEFVKVLIVLFFAAYLAEYRPLGWRASMPRLLVLRSLAPLLVVLAVSLALLVVQGDLGGALLYFAVVLIMLYAATGRTWYAAMGGAAFLGSAAAAYAVLPHVRLRVDAWLNPWKDAAGSGYQVIQSTFALGSGGITGSGLGYGHPDLIPAAHTDLIFAAVGEELGFIGAMAVLALYLLLVLRAMRIARGAQGEFPRLLAVGAGSVLAVQSAVILGGTMRMLPLTGITLPFMSYGGSSVLSNFLLLGLLLAVSGEKETGETAAEGRWVRDGPASA